MKNTIISTLVLLCFSVICETALAQETGTLEGSIQEQYSDYVPSKGGVLVGLKFQALNLETQSSSLHKTTITLPEKTKKVCFVARSKDGFYNADGVLKVPTGKQRTFRIAQKSEWKFIEKTRLYKEHDMAPLASIGRGCETERKPVLVPITVTKGSSRLVASINSQRALNLRSEILVDGVIVQGVCEPLRNTPHTAFDMQCAFDLSDVGGEKGQITIRRQPRSGRSRVDRWNVALANP